MGNVGLDSPRSLQLMEVFPFVGIAAAAIDQPLSVTSESFSPISLKNISNFSPSAPEHDIVSVTAFMEDSGKTFVISGAPVPGVPNGSRNGRGSTQVKLLAVRRFSQNPVDGFNSKLDKLFEVSSHLPSFASSDLSRSQKLASGAVVLTTSELPL